MLKTPHQASTLALSSSLTVNQIFGTIDQLSLIELSTLSSHLRQLFFVWTLFSSSAQLLYCKSRIFSQPITIPLYFFSQDTSFWFPRNSGFVVLIFKLSEIFLNQHPSLPHVLLHPILWYSCCFLSCQNYLCCCFLFPTFYPLSYCFLSSQNFWHMWFWTHAYQETTVGQVLP